MTYGSARRGIDIRRSLTGPRGGRIRRAERHLEGQALAFEPNQDSPIGLRCRETIDVAPASAPGSNG